MRAWLVAAAALLAACTSGPGGGTRDGGGRDGGGRDGARADDDRSVYAYRRFVMHRDGGGARMLLDARSGRTWYRAADSASVWRPFRVLGPDTARNYSPLRGLRRDTTREDDGEDDGGTILLRFEIHDERTLPLLLDRRSGRTWVRELRADGPWWVPLEVVPADTSGNYAPLQVTGAAPAAPPG